MFIKNYSDVDLTVKYHGHTIILEAGTVTYVDEEWISPTMIKVMFGNYVEQVKYDTPIEEFMYDNKFSINLDQIYSIKEIGPGVPRIFIYNAKADLYFSDEEDKPNLENMMLFDTYKKVSGLLTIETLPKWIMVKRHRGSKTPIVLATNFVMGELA